MVTVLSSCNGGPSFQTSMDMRRGSHDRFRKVVIEHFQRCRYLFNDFLRPFGAKTVFAP